MAEREWSPILRVGERTDPGRGRLDTEGLRRWFAEARGPFSLLVDGFGRGEHFRRAASTWLTTTRSGCLTYLAVVDRALPAGLARVAEAPEPGLPPGFDARWLDALPPPHRGTFLLRPVPGRVHLLLLQDTPDQALAGLVGPIDAVLGDLGIAPRSGPPGRSTTDPVTVVGAGLAGACVARFLADHGLHVVVVDAGPPPGKPSGALRGSTNPWLSCRPYLAAGPNPLAALTHAGWQLREVFGDALSPLEGFVMGPRTGKLAQHHRKVRERWHGSPWLHDVPATGTTVREGYLQSAAGVLDGPRAVAHLLRDLDVRWSTPAPLEGPVVWCAGAPRRGRWAPVVGTVTLGRHRVVAPDLAVGAGPYAIDTAAGTVIGATRHRGTSLPDDDAEQLAATVRARLGLDVGDPVVSWQGVRAKTPDHAPVVGLVDDGAVSAGHGSKGSVTAPIAAALVAAQWLGLPWPVPRAVARAVDPARRVLHEERLRKGRE